MKRVLFVFLLSIVLIASGCGTKSELPINEEETTIEQTTEESSIKEETIAEGHTAEEIDRVIDLVKKSYFKRHTPPAPRLRTQSISKYL